MIGETIRPPLRRAVSILVSQQCLKETGMFAAMATSGIGAIRAASVGREEMGVQHSSRQAGHLRNVNLGGCSMAAHRSALATTLVLAGSLACLTISSFAQADISVCNAALAKDVATTVHSQEEDLDFISV